MVTSISGRSTANATLLFQPITMLPKCCNHALTATLGRFQCNLRNGIWDQPQAAKYIGHNSLAYLHPMQEVASSGDATP